MILEEIFRNIYHANRSAYEYESNHTNMNEIKTILVHKTIYLSLCFHPFGPDEIDREYSVSNEKIRVSCHHVHHVPLITFCTFSISCVLSSVFLALLFGSLSHTPLEKGFAFIDDNQSLTVGYIVKRIIHRHYHTGE